MSGTVFVETIRRHLGSIPFIAFLVMISLISAIAGAMGGPAQMWQGFVNLFVIVIACQLIGPEFSSGTLQLILAKPVTRSAYLLARAAGVVAVAWIGVWIPFAFDAGGRLLGQNGTMEWSALASSAVNLSLDAFLICALMALFGSFTRSYLNVAIYFGLEIALALSGSAIESVTRDQFPGLHNLASFLRRNDWISRSVRAAMNNLFPSATPQFSRQWALMVVTNGAIALLLACMIFRRREVPYGAD